MVNKSYIIMNKNFIVYGNGKINFYTSYFNINGKVMVVTNPAYGNYNTTIYKFYNIMFSEYQGRLPVIKVIINYYKKYPKW